MLVYLPSGAEVSSTDQQVAVSLLLSAQDTLPVLREENVPLGGVMDPQPWSSGTVYP